MIRLYGARRYAGPRVWLLRPLDRLRWTILHSQARRRKVYGTDAWTLRIIFRVVNAAIDRLVSDAPLEPDDAAMRRFILREKSQ